MRTVIAVTIIIMAAVLLCCANIARRSDKDIAPKLTLFLYSLLPPVTGNLIIIIAHTEWAGLLGRYIYVIGIDFTMYCLLSFTLQYCGFEWQKGWHTVVITCVALDIVQILCNPIFSHAFAPDMQIVDGAPYYNVHSYTGRNLHLGMVYLFMIVVLILLIGKTLHSAKIYTEKYIIMFSLLFITGLWELFYLLSRTPVKRSVIAYGVFGILVFYFSLYYRSLRLLDHLLADFASGLTDGLFFFDDTGRCVWADEHALKFIDTASPANGEDDPAAASSGSNDFSRCTEHINRLFPGLDLEKNDWECQKSLGNRYYTIAKHTIMDSRNKVMGSVLSLQDNTDAEVALQKERYIANHDSLTDLFTKQHLFNEIRKRIDSNPDTKYYVAFMDVNNFKLVNDLFGKEFGDHALQSIASHIKHNLPPTSLYGRLGGDSFGFCFSEDEFNLDLAEKFMSEFIIKGDSFSHRIMMHEGVYPVTERGIDISTMFDRANIALQTIKNDYKRHVVVYDDKMRDKVLFDQDTTLQLPEALATRQIRPYLQAIVDEDGNVIGAEALVRWIHPQRGFLSPASFIPNLEHNGMIADVDRHMWRCACEILKNWEKKGHSDLFISINVSPKDFYFMDVKKELQDLVKEYDIPASRLRVEITESVMMDDTSDKLLILKELQESGFMVEMDDFGSGYSSLNMLKNMPVDIVKIDMMFINDMENLPRTATVLKNVINMMTELGLVPLTEGIETEEQYRLLSNMGCKLFQGYLFAKPMPTDDFENQFLRRQEAS